MFKRFLSWLNEDVAYKGYLIRVHPITGDVWIERDGHKISYAKSVEDAKATINMLTEDGGAGGGAGGVGGIANAAGTVAVAGLGVGPKGEPGVDNRKRKKKLKEHRVVLWEAAKPNVRVTVDARDYYGTLEKLLKYIGTCGNGGHSFEILVD